MSQGYSKLSHVFSVPFLLYTFPCLVGTCSHHELLLVCIHENIPKLIFGHLFVVLVCVLVAFTRCSSEVANSLVSSTTIDMLKVSVGFGICLFYDTNPKLFVIAVGEGNSLVG